TTTANIYAGSVRMLLLLTVIVLCVYGGLLYLTYLGFTKGPTGIIPSTYTLYLLVDVRLPDSSSLERTQAVMAQVEKIARGDGSSHESHGSADHHAGGGIPGIAHT